MENHSTIRSVPNICAFIQPGWAECVFIFSLGLYFVCLYCFNLFVCPHPFVFPWAVESIPLTGFGAGVTRGNLNEPPEL